MSKVKKMWTKEIYETGKNSLDKLFMLLQLQMRMDFSIYAKVFSQICTKLFCKRQLSVTRYPCVGN